MVVVVMSDHPKDLVTPHMVRVKPMMSWYTDGARELQSGTAQMMSGGH